MVYSGGGNGNPLQYSCLGNPMERGAWPATVLGVTESGTTQQLSMHGVTVTPDNPIANTENHTLSYLIEQQDKPALFKYGTTSYM